MPVTRATKAKGGATAASAAGIALPGVTSAVPADRGAVDVPADSVVLAGPVPAGPVPEATAARGPAARAVLAAPVAVEIAVPAPVADRVSLGIPARDPGGMEATVVVVVRTSVRSR
jgi:hypothetical protein